MGKEKKYNSTEEGIRRFVEYYGDITRDNIQEFLDLSQNRLYIIAERYYDQMDYSKEERNFLNWGLRDRSKHD